MAVNDDLVLSSLGFKMYTGTAGKWTNSVEPVSVTVSAAEEIAEATRLVGVSSFGGFGITIDTVDSTEVDGNGFGRFVATLKNLKPVTVTLNKRVQAVYDLLYNLAFNTETSNQAFYKDYLVLYPNGEGGYWGLAFTACITDFSLGDVNTQAVQNYTIVLQGQSKPVKVTATVSST